MSYMLEKLDSPSSTQGGENLEAESISRKDVWLAWLAGIIDGEGCISAYWWKQTNPSCPENHGLRISVSISNTHPVLIHKITEVLVMHGIQFTVPASKTRKRREFNEKPCVSVIIMGKERLRKLLPLVIPYLTAKQRQARLALELIEYRESLAICGRESKGRFGNMNLRDDERINHLMSEIKREKHEIPSVLNFSRHANSIFGESSTTLCSSGSMELEDKV